MIEQCKQVIFILNQTMGFILSYCYYCFHKRLISVNNLRSTGINTEEWGGDNYFFSVMAGTVYGFKLLKNLGDKQGKGNAY